MTDEEAALAKKILADLEGKSNKPDDAAPDDLLEIPPHLQREVKL